jgi:glycine cleavage system H protein
MYPTDLKYTSEHIWLRLEDAKKGRVGLTFYGQEQLKKVVFVELPSIGAEVVQKEPFGSIESRKAVVDLYSPVSGTVVEVNHLLETEPDWVNQDPYGKGWMILVELSNPAEIDSLLSAGKYQALTTP